MRRLSFLASSILFVIGCGGGDSGVPDQCNPLGGAACVMPWPWSGYLEPADTATGYQVALPIEAMPRNIDDKPVDPAMWDRYDGFGPSGTILAGFPNGVSADGLPGWQDPAASLAAGGPIVLVDMDDGHQPLFFAEVDMNTG